ncbi:MAG: sugar phosphate isomerase/epimerase [Oscillospiraceae bacterium]|jgi:sugar phosphate isomerase/epimerase|nr:sugar phosphate isomerase/epimerase [Oscillospiraceae bacterium]
MKVGFCSVNYSELSIEQVAELAARSGYEALEIPSYENNGQIDVDELLKGDNAKQFKKRIEDTGLFLSGISNHADSPLVLGPHGEDAAAVCNGTPAEQIEFGRKSLLRSARLANALEVPAVVAFSGVGNFGRFNDWPYPNGWAREEEAFVERYTPILDAYREYGVKLAFEPHPNNVIYDIHTAKRALELTENHPALAFNLDPANMLFTGIRIETFIDELKDRIALVHAKDCEIVEHNLHMGGYWMYQGNWGALNRSFRFRIPGWGSINWKSFITELFLVGYDGVISYEHEDVTMSRADGLAKTIEFLKPLMIHAPYEGRTDKLFTR